MPRFTIIIPVHNAALYLRECLDSVLSQTLDDFEVILVDDGSTDGSSSILDEYVRKETCFSVLHKENAGVSSARNAGIELAKGDYLCFVDADDIIAPNYLEALYGAIGEVSDSSMGGFRLFFSDGRLGPSVIPDRKKIENLEENLAEFYDFHQKQWQHYLWNRMFKASVIRNNNLHFREDISYKEDGLFVVQFLCASNGYIGCSNQLIYHYRANCSGAMSKVIGKFDSKIFTNLVAHYQIISILRNKEVSNSLISLAETQAKSVANWIQVSLRGHLFCNINYVFKTEFLMIKILGCKEYFTWRSNRLSRI